MRAYNYDHDVIRDCLRRGTNTITRLRKKRDSIELAIAAELEAHNETKRIAYEIGVDLSKL